MARRGVIILTYEDLVGFEDIFADSNYNYSNGNLSYEDNICDLNESMYFEAVFIPVLYSVALVVGILGNGVLLAILVQSRKTWSVTDMFILHLGVADVLMLLTLPLWATQATRSEGWTFGTHLCKITGAAFKINFYCGIFLLVCISLERYLSIVHATKMYSRRKPAVVQLSCLAVWVFSFLLSIPDWIFLEAVEDARRNKIECIPNYLKFVTQSGGDSFFLSDDDIQSMADWRLASRLIYHIVGFLLPSAALIFCYSSILLRLRCGTRDLQKKKASRVIVVVVAAFFACWTPYNITLMVDTLHSNNSNTCGERTSMKKAKTITSTVGILQCILNPILYAFVGVKFRRQLLDTLRSLGCKRKTSAKVHSSVCSRRSSFRAESVETSHSIAV